MLIYIDDMLIVGKQEAVGEATNNIRILFGSSSNQK